MSHLGEILLASGVISAPSLNRALQIQSSTGGRLGTVLLEQGMITEDTLARALAKCTGRDYAAWPRVKEAAREVIELLPPRVAVRHAAVPFEKAGRLLRIAMRDPADLAAEDEIAFVSSCKLETFVLTEARVAEALERFYGERRSTRFRALGERLDRLANAPPLTPAPPQPPPPAAIPPPPQIFGPRAKTGETPRPSTPTPAPTGRISDVFQSPDFLTPDKIEISTWHPPSASGPSPVPAETPPPAEVEFFEVDGGGMAAEPSAAAPLPPTPEECTQRILAAQSREDIAEAVLDLLAPKSPLVALFISRKDDVIGWNARGQGISRSAFKAIRIPYSEPSLFLTIKMSGLPYQGVFPDQASHRELLEAFGRTPGHVAIFPVQLRRRAVAYLCAELEKDSAVEDDLRQLRETASAMAKGFGKLILDRRGKA